MQLTQECRNAKTIGISGHIRPDGDCVGSTIALYLYLKKVCGDAHVHLFLEKPSDTMKEIKSIAEIDSNYEWEDIFDVFFALDCTADRLGKAEPYFNAAVKSINIDHHVSNKQGSGSINYLEPAASSTSELIYDLIKQDVNSLTMEERMDEEMALAIYIGIIHDTGVFQYSNTAPKTLITAAALIEYGFDFPRIIEETFYQKTYVQNQILGRALLESFQLMNGKCVVSCISRKTMEFYGVEPIHLDGIVNQLRNMKQVDCAIFMYEIGMMEYKVSLRTTPKVDASRIAVYFGGGGHARAAGCTLKGNFHDCVNNLSLHIAKQLGECND